MKKLLTALLVALLIASMLLTALASTVRTTGNVWLRKGPGKGYGKIRSIASGRKLEYLGKSSVDSRGVRWYRVRYDGSTGWVSSRYAKLSGSSSSSSSSSSKKSTATKKPTTTKKPSATPTPEPEETLDDVISFTDNAEINESLATAIPDDVTATSDAEAASAALVPDLNAPEAVELSTWYLRNLEEAATALHLGTYKKDESAEWPVSYSNESLLISGDTKTEHFRVTGEGYAIYGVSIGTDMDAAIATLTAAGLARTDNILGASFQHYATAESTVNVQGFDSFINIIADFDNKVSEISWSVYTGDWTNADNQG